jgi:eukaryotic-like serine/threonine-protein kinase
MRVRHEEPVRPGEVVHGYRVERKLGQGGFSRVYLAWQGGRPYALKFTHLEHAREWAKRELHILVDFQHANVVRLVGHVRAPDEAREYLVLVMEYVPGRTLYQWAEEENPSAREVARMVVKLCRALAAVHAARVLHRDLKGDNVLVRDGDGEPVLVDFGLGHVPWAPSVTQGCLAPGSPAYRSPECARFLVSRTRREGEKYPYAVTDDLFALGVTLYVLLTDVFPFEAGNEWELMRAIVLEEPPAPHELNRRVPRALSELCMRLLEKDPAARFASAEAMGEALETMLAEADGSWDFPLCYGWDAAGLSTQNAPELVPMDEEELWRGWARKQPRRGRKPPAERPVRARPRSWLLLAAGVCGPLVVGLGGDHPLLASGPRRDTALSTAPAPTGPALASLLRAGPSSGGPTSEACLMREVAPSWTPPEAGAGAAPARADTPAPVVMVTTLRKGETRLKKTEHKDLDTRAERGLGAELARLCIGAAAAANAACAAAPQVYPRPEPQACPAGSIEVMTRRFNLVIDQQSPPVFLPGTNRRALKAELLAVQEGPVSITLLAPWERMPSKTVISGRLVFGPERVYGRFTEAHLPGGESVPVCFALVPYAPRAPQGLPIEGTVGPGTVKVFPYGEVRAVERFD